MKALTLWQPWASLIAEGVKTIETRPWPAPSKLIGERLAIHAALTSRPWEDLWRDAHEGPPGSAAWAILHALGSGDTFSTWYVGGGLIAGVPVEGVWADDYDPDVHPGGFLLPFGCVAATARLVACVPMVEIGADPPEDHLTLAYGGSRLHLWHFEVTDITDQLPYGDFRPGRWAWLLDDIEKLPDPIPARGRQKLWEWTR